MTPLFAFSFGEAMEIKSGGTYFVVTFFDSDLSVPLIRTLIFRRKVSTDSGSTKYLFDQLSDGSDSVGFSIDSEYLDELLVDRDGLISTLSKGFDGTLALSPKSTDGLL